MANSITVDPARLQTAATTMDQQISDYERDYNKLYSEVDAMGAAWQGTDNQAFVTQIDGFQQSFKAMVTLMRDYSEFLKSASKFYTQSQSDTVNGAKRLTN